MDWEMIFARYSSDKGINIQNKELKKTEHQGWWNGLSGRLPV
jgi:hypothetical protein